MDKKRYTTLDIVAITQRIDAARRLLDYSKNDFAKQVLNVTRVAYWNVKKRTDRHYHGSSYLLTSMAFRSSGYFTAKAKFLVKGEAMCNSSGKRFIKMTTQKFFTDEKIFEVMEKAKEECRKYPTKYAQLKLSLKFKKKAERDPYDPSDPSLEDYFVDELFKQAAMEAEKIVRNPNHYVNPMLRKTKITFQNLWRLWKEPYASAKRLKDINV